MWHWRCASLTAWTRSTWGWARCTWAGWWCEACRRSLRWCPPPAARWSCGNASCSSHHLYSVSWSRTQTPCSFLSVLASPLISRDISGARSLSLASAARTQPGWRPCMCTIRLLMHAQHDQLLGERDACTERKGGTRFEENRQFLHCHWFACSARRAAAMASRKGQNVRVSRDSGVVLCDLHQQWQTHWAFLNHTVAQTRFLQKFAHKNSTFWKIIITIISSCLIICFILHGMDCSNICHFKPTIYFSKVLFVSVHILRFVSNARAFVH